MSTPFKMKGWSPFTQVDPDITQELKPLSKQQLKVIKQNYDVGHSVGYNKGVDVGHKRGIANKNLAMQRAFEAGRGGFWKRALRRFWPAALGIAAWEGIQRYKQSKKKKSALKQNGPVEPLGAGGVPIVGKPTQTRTTLFPKMPEVEDTSGN